MAKKQGGYWWMLAAAVLTAFAYGCSGRDAVEDTVDHGGSLVSEEGQIAFTHAPKANWADLPSSDADVYVIGVDGSGERRLTDSPGLDGFPAWSPDGERIAFVSARDGGNCEIYVVDADGSRQVRLTRTPEDEYFLAWSPDGEQIAFSSMEDGEFYVMNVDGSGRTRLTDIPKRYDHWPPTWSPDGKRIAFTSEDKKGPEIYVMNPDGSGLTKLTYDPAEEFYPAWRP